MKVKQLKAKERAEMLQKKKELIEEKLRLQTELESNRQNYIKEEEVKKQNDQMKQSVMQMINEQQNNLDLAME